MNPGEDLHPNNVISTFEHIADGLATRGFAVADDFLSTEEVAAILLIDGFQNFSENFKKAGVGKRQGIQINETIRGDYIQWLDKHNAPASATRYLDRLQALMQYLNRSLFLSLKDFEVHMTAYPAGSFYKRHLDQFKHDDHRKLSVICYLNTDWQAQHGGQLRMYLAQEQVDILPIAGRLVCFRSDAIEHEVLPATRARLSLTGWMLDQEVVI